MLRISQIKLSLFEEESLLENKIREKLKISKRTAFTFHIHRKNIDARNKKLIYFVYSVDVQIDKEKELLKKRLKDVVRAPKPYSNFIQKGIQFIKNPPIIVGFGPAGIFSALLLAQKGYCPVVFERGEDIDSRSKSVDQFIQTALLNEESNIQFGEGGAGTFSDGKLTARSKDSRVQFIYDTLVAFNAPNEITYEGFPHIGSDRLKVVIKNIRNEIIRLGGTIHFSSRVDQLVIEDHKVQGVIVNAQRYDSHQVILALGNSARDSIKQFYNQGLEMEAKEFAIGLRIEHHQEAINKALYHEFYNHSSLHSANYFLSNQKGAYTFCMCPGGMVVAATSLKEHVVVNGMSNYKRDEVNANSAILVSVDCREYGEGLFDGMDYIDQLEKVAYKLGGSDYKAPAQRVIDYINDVPSTNINHVKPSYPIGVKLCNLNVLFSKEINHKIKQGLYDFNQKLEGFINEDALLCAIETRSSSPIRISRDKESLVSISIEGIYPCGEGAGYAGGIISSAIDGIKCAEAIIKLYNYEQ